MREEKRKETLTRDNIRQDLKRNLRKQLIRTVFAIVALITLPVFCILELRQGIWPEFRRPVYTWALYILVMIFVSLAIVYIYRLFGGMRKMFITTGKLISADYDESGNNGYHYTWCYLTFAGHDKYTVRTVSGKTLHPWSTLYPLSAEGEYYYASAGDEYYLVLSKPHSGKILMVYNKKLFELVD